jgi:hypothetical protein
MKRERRMGYPTQPKIYSETMQGAFGDEGGAP